MKHLHLLLLSFILIFSSSIILQAKNALVIIAHGAPSPQWIAPVTALEKEVTNLLVDKGVKDFDYVRVALMEFIEPSIATVISDCEKQRIDHIYAIPLFIAPSSHSEQDIPNILRLKSNAETIKALKEEGTKLVDTTIPVTLGPTLAYGDIIKSILLDRVKALSIEPKQESLILLAHGSPEYEPFWKEMIKDAGQFITKQTSIPTFDYAFIEMGQRFNANAVPKINAAAKKSKRIIVQGIYLSSGVDKIAKQSQGIKSKDKIVYGPCGLLPDSKGRISQWIVTRACEMISK